MPRGQEKSERHSVTVRVAALIAQLLDSHVLLSQKNRSQEHSESQMEEYELKICTIKHKNTVSR